MIVWQRFNTKYINGQECTLGKWVIFSVFFNGATSREDPNKYALACKLPGIKPTLGHFKTEEEAIEKANKVLSYWLEKAELKVIDNE